MIRLASLDDVPVIEGLTREYYDLLPHSRFGEYSRSKTLLSINQYLTSPKEERIILLAENDGHTYGLLCGLVTEMVFAKEKKAYESVWYVQERFKHYKDGLRLLDAYEYWAKVCGCSSVGLSFVGDNPRLEAYYTKRGYTKLEQSFTRSL